MEIYVADFIGVDEPKLEPGPKPKPQEAASILLLQPEPHKNMQTIEVCTILK
jgi:hypothetical protein